MDAAAPAYEYATQSAEARGLPSIFTMLARQAQAMLLRLPHKHDPASRAAGHTDASFLLHPL